MGFTTVIGTLKKGKKLRRIEWASPETYIFFKKGVIKIHVSNGQIMRWIIYQADVLADDWVIL